MFHKLHQSCYEVFSRAAQENRENERDNNAETDVAGTDVKGILTIRGIQKSQKVI